MIALWILSVVVALLIGGCFGFVLGFRAYALMDDDEI